MRIRHLDPDSETDVKSLLVIYRDSIEPSEQKSPDDMRALTRDSRYLVLIAEVEDRIVGFAIVYLPATRDFWLLEYMAVAATERSLGLGTALYRATVEAAANRVSGPGLLEVDRPDAIVSSNNEVARRLKFYRRLGCHRIEGLIYVLPLEGAGTPPAMQLLVAAMPQVQSIPLSTITRWLRTLYTEVYGQQAEDPRIAEMIAGLPAFVPTSNLIDS